MGTTDILVSAQFTYRLGFGGMVGAAGIGFPLFEGEALSASLCHYSFFFETCWFWVSVGKHNGSCLVSRLTVSRYHEEKEAELDSSLHHTEEAVNRFLR